MQKQTTTPYFADMSFSSDGSDGADVTRRRVRQSSGMSHDSFNEIKFSCLQKFLNANGRYQCPRANCNRTYKDASSLQRHIR